VNNAKKAISVTTASEENKVAVNRRLTPIILDTKEAEMRRIQFEAGPSE
jgi:hypothetical protein